MPNLQEKLKEAAALGTKLAASLSVQAVWPQAFKNGNSCTLKCHTKLDPNKFRRVEIVTRAWLERSDGEEFPLTLEQYQSLGGKFKCPTQ